MLRIFAHWQLPLVCAFVWWGMLIAMLAVWSASGRPSYRTNQKGYTLVYISDVGGYVLKALFIPCAAVQGVFFVLSLAAERYLRHAGRLCRNNRRREKVFATIAIVLSIPGQIGILMVAVFDEIRYNKVHYCMLIVFLCCIGVSIMFTILEFFYLDNSYSGVRRLRVSYTLKACFLAGALVLVIGFAVSHQRRKRVVAAVFEWFLAFWYGFYLLTLAYDLFPAFRRNSRADQAEAKIDDTITHSWLGKKANYDNQELVNEKYNVNGNGNDSDIESNIIVNNNNIHPAGGYTRQPRQNRQPAPQMMQINDPSSNPHSDSHSNTPIGNLVYENRKSHLGETGEMEYVEKDYINSSDQSYIESQPPNQIPSQYQYQPPNQPYSNNSHHHHQSKLSSDQRSSESEATAIDYYQNQTQTPNQNQIPQQNSRQQQYQNQNINQSPQY